MRTVTFQEVLHGTARLLGLNPTRDLTTERAATLTQYINRSIKPAWNFDWWPEWMLCEQRKYRQDYITGEFIEAGAQRYHSGSDKYYQALQQQLTATQAPATTSDGSTWTENSAYWAELRTDYSAALQTNGETLNPGDQRMDVDTRKVYQIHTTHTASGRNVNTSYARELVLFRRYIAFEQEGRTAIGAVSGVYLRDPHTQPRRPGRMNHRLNGDGIVVIPGAQTPMVATASVPTRVWIEYRLRPPQFTSTPWNASTAPYDRDALVYYNGDTFKSLVGNNSNAVDGSSTWALVEFPQVLMEQVCYAAAANALDDQKQNERAMAYRTEANELLGQARDNEITSQQEPETAEVMTYAS